MKLNLGCGTDHIEGFVNVDKVGGDVTLDLESYPWPWGDDSIAEIVCFHVIEHLHELVPFINECNRILAPSCRMTIKTPHPLCEWFYEDPTHIRGYAPNIWSVCFCGEGVVNYDMGIRKWAGCNVRVDTRAGDPRVVEITAVLIK